MRTRVWPWALVERKEVQGLAFFQKFGLVFDSQKRPVRGKGRIFSLPIQWPSPVSFPRPGLLYLASCFETAYLSHSTRLLLKVIGLRLRVQGLHLLL